jgi:hypothetical protein
MHNEPRNMFLLQTRLAPDDFDRFQALMATMEHASGGLSARRAAVARACILRGMAELERELAAPKRTSRAKK